MSRWGYATIVLVIASVGAALVDLGDVVIFALSTASIVPAAGLIGRATEALAHHVGPRFGGLLNATFGNASELIITSFAVQRGLLTLVKASITGSIIGNTLLVLGTALLLGGAHHRIQCFDSREATRNATMMILAVAGLYLPAMISRSVGESAVLERLSLMVAVVLMLTYLAYLGYTVLRPSAHRSGSDTRAQDAPDDEEEETWGLWYAIGMLALGTVGAAVGSELLVGTIEPVTQQLGLSELFVGVIIVPIVGNAAEHVSAIQQAWRNRLEATLSIAAGSSTQVALFVAPTVVFLSLLLGHPMNLLFSGLELTVLGLATAIFAYVSLDGESNWLEGVQLLALYVMASLAFFVIPGII